MLDSPEGSRADHRDPEQLARIGLPLVGHVVADVVRRLPRHVHRDDLVSAGMLGLASAVRTWDAGRGVPFESYARLRIQGAILDELRRLDWASRTVRADVRRQGSTVEELTATLGRRPSRAEVATALGVTSDAVQRVEGHATRAVVTSLDALPVGTDDRPASSPAPAEAVVEQELKQVLGAAIDSLPDRLRTVVVEYFFEERPMQAIAADLGITESRVSQLRAEAVRLLRDGVDSQLDPERVEDLHVTRGRTGRRKSAYYAAVAQATAARAAGPVAAAGAPSVAAAAGSVRTF